MNTSSTYQGWFLKTQWELLSADGISTNNLYAYAALPGASLQDCPWKLASSDILVILFHCSPQTAQCECHGNYRTFLLLSQDMSVNHLQSNPQIRADQSSLKPSMSTFLWFVMAHKLALNLLEAQIWDVLILFTFPGLQIICIFKGQVLNSWHYPSIPWVFWNCSICG